VTVRRRTATYPRALRVNQVLRQVLAEELERLADADEVPMVTVTSVEVAPDMRTAVVFLASMPEETQLVLEEQRGHLQHLIGSRNCCADCTSGARGTRGSRGPGRSEPRGGERARRGTSAVEVSSGRHGWGTSAVDVASGRQGWATNRVDTAENHINSSARSIGRQG